MKNGRLGKQADKLTNEKTNRQTGRQAEIEAGKDCGKQVRWEDKKAWCIIMCSKSVPDYPIDQVG